MHKNSVLSFANKYSIDVETVLIVLMYLGLNLRHSSNIVARKKLKALHNILSEMPKQEIHRDTTAHLKQNTLEESVSGLLDKSINEKLIPWKIIGTKEKIYHLSVDEVLFIHDQLIKDFKNTNQPMEATIINKGLLISAIQRPHAAFGQFQKYPTVIMAAASLLYGLVLNHGLADGNKRVAFVSLIVFLDKNERVIEVVDDEMEKFLLDIANHGLEENGIKKRVAPDKELMIITAWLNTRIRRVNNQEYVTKFHNVKTILKGFGCQIDESIGGNRAKVTRGKLITTISLQNQGKDIDRIDMKVIRRDLHLDDDHGIDSNIFYRGAPRVSDFILKYRKLLLRLANY